MTLGVLTGLPGKELVRKMGFSFPGGKAILALSFEGERSQFSVSETAASFSNFPWKVWLQNFCCYSTVCHWVPRVHSHALFIKNRTEERLFSADWSHSAEFQTHCVASCALDLAHVSKGGQEKLFCSTHPCFKCQYLLQTSSITCYRFSVVIVTLHITTLY